MIVGTAGHIDHGKTTLVRALTGVDTDRLPEEKRRGITIELGFAPLQLEGVGTVGLVDVPGHEGFVRTMLAGATGVDVGLLVIAADEGVMPQTREHLAILSLLAVRACVVALTKCDAVDDDWRALVRDDVRALLETTPFASAPIVETSATTLHGIESLKATLRETLQSLPERDADDLFRLPIDRAFTVKGTGSVVTGTVWSGASSLDTPLRLFPANRPVRARTLQAHGRQLSVIRSGMRAAVALAGVDLSELSRGATLVQEGGWEATRTLRADVALLDSIERPLRPREWVRLHLGTMEVGARVVAQGGALEAHQVRGARIVLDEPIIARALDRFVLRRTSPMQTIGGGVITDPLPPRRRAKPWPVSLAAADRLVRMAAESLADGVDLRQLPVRLGVRPHDVDSICRNSALTLIEGRVYLRDFIDKSVLTAVSRVSQYHQDHPLDERVPLSGLRAAMGLTSTLTDHVMEIAQREGLLEVASGGARATGWKPTVSSTAQVAIEGVATRLEAAAFEPPSVSELRAELGANDPVPFLRILEREGRVVQVETDRFYSATAFNDLVRRLREGMVPGRVYSPSELRELLGTSRKYLIPFLEFCDRHRITERREQGRVLA